MSATLPIVALDRACEPAPAPDDGSILLRGIVEIAAGSEHTCARMKNGTVRCWGHAEWGQTGPARYTPLPTLVPGLFAATQVVAGSFHSCARVASGDVLCWGQDIPYSFPRTILPPHARRAFHDAAQISAETTTCARMKDGSVRCSGLCNMRAAGAPVAGVPEDDARVIPGFPPAKSVVVGGFQGCVITKSDRARGTPDGSVVCWDEGAPMEGGGSRMTLPTEITPLPPVVELASGSGHTCAKTIDNEVFCWGVNYHGQLGDGTTAPSAIPKPVRGLSSVVQIAAGGQQSCARLASGRVVCWGATTNGEGDGGFLDNLAPTDVPGARGAQSVSVGGAHACALFADGHARCWGENRRFQLGDGTQKSKLVPVPVRERLPAELPPK
jgi:hypothetical protein